MLSSWKKTTFSKGYKYLNAIFNWIDSIDYATKYKKKYNSNRFLLIKFEEVHNKPKIISKKLCNFLGIKMDKNMITPSKWSRLLKNKFIYVNVSAYDSKTVYGFSIKRTYNWKKNLEDWEISLIEHLCGSRMKKIGYKINKKNSKLYKKGLKIMNKDALLKRRLRTFLNENSIKVLSDDIKINQPIRSLGNHEIELNPYEGIIDNINIIVKKN